eukprot:gene4058-9988_t
MMGAAEAMVGGGLVDALEQASCYSSCEIANNDDDANDSIFGASCTAGDGSSALKSCCAKCGAAAQLASAFVVVLAAAVSMFN